jgi:hypothetical protein
MLIINSTENDRLIASVSPVKTPAKVSEMSDAYLQHLAKEIANDPAIANLQVPKKKRGKRKSRAAKRLAENNRQPKPISGREKSPAKSQKGLSSSGRVKTPVKEKPRNSATTEWADIHRQRRMKEAQKLVASINPRITFQTATGKRTCTVTSTSQNKTNTAERISPFTRDNWHNPVLRTPPKPESMVSRVGTLPKNIREMATRKLQFDEDRREKNPKSSTASNSLDQPSSSSTRQQWESEAKASGNSATERNSPPKKRPVVDTTSTRTPVIQWSPERYLRVPGTVPDNIRPACYREGETIAKPYQQELMMQMLDIAASGEGTAEERKARIDQLFTSENIDRVKAMLERRAQSPVNYAEMEPYDPVLPTKPPLVKLPEDEEAESYEGACIVCFDRKVNTINWPCCHFMFCWTCSEDARKEKRTCDYCRQPVEERKRPIGPNSKEVKKKE